MVSACILLVDLPDEYVGCSQSEMIGLVNAAVNKRELVFQVKRSSPDAKYFIGKGRLNDFKEYCIQNSVDQVFVNHDLSPSVQKNLSKYLSIDVVDRTELILHIFALHARTFEGKLQVELAQLIRLSTRLIRGWTHLERQKGGIGLRGPGETQLETDRRLIRARIKHIKKKLEDVKKQRQQINKARYRSRIPKIVLVGYTNAGKSTLFNELTKAQVFVADAPFATLDPTIRAIALSGIESAILVDTVGFIKGLPPEIIAAFRATLSEIHQADLLLHVVDATLVEKFGHATAVEDVNKVLNALDLVNIPIIYVYNKQDLLNDSLIVMENVIQISATKLIGLENLKNQLALHLGKKLVSKTIFLHFNKAALRAYIHERKWILTEITVSQGWWLKLQLPYADLLKLGSFN